MPRILCPGLACCPRDWWRNLPEISRATPTDTCVCQQYSFTFTVENGLPPYTWSMTGPVEGLTLDSHTGILSGVPVFADTYEFTITVTDVIGRTDSRDFVLVVVASDDDACGIEMEITSAVTAFDGTYVDLIWSSPTFPYMDDAYYRIFRNGTLLVQVAQGTNTYHDTTVESAQSYTYAVFFHHGSECPAQQTVAAILDVTGFGIIESGSGDIAVILET